MYLQSAAGPSSFSLDPLTLAYVAGRHGNETAELLGAAKQGELEQIEQVPNLWAELRWAARDEGVVHLEDLLLRRDKPWFTFTPGRP